MKMSSHICINIVLIVIYIHYFGLPSIKKYVHKGVIIVMEEDKESQIIPPGTLSDGYIIMSKMSKIEYSNILVITILPWNRTGWKNDEDDIPCKEEDKGKKFIECVENNSYTAKELLLTGVDFSTPEKYLTKSKGYFANNMSAIHQYFTIDPGDITYESQTTLWITLNKSLNYYIYLMDPKLHITSDSPDIVPRILLTLNKNTQLFFHYKVAAQAQDIKSQKISTKSQKISTKMCACRQLDMKNLIELKTHVSHRLVTI